MPPKLGRDGLPRPRTYLLAGVPRPNPGQWADPRVGTFEEVEQFLKAQSAGVGRPDSLTVVDRDGRPIAVISGASSRYLAAIPTRKLLGTLTTEVTYEPHGFASYLEDRGARDEYFEQPALLESSLDVRPVTVDLSVLVRGLDRSLFDKRDAIFVSVGLQLELALVLVGEDRAGTIVRGTGSPNWSLSVPVPLDETLISVYRELDRDLRPPISYGSPLTRTDLLCAATAITYESPLYTTHPDDYETVGHGLRVVEYGPVRNKAVLKEREQPNYPRAIRTVPTVAAPVTAPTVATPSREERPAALIASFRKGFPFDDAAERLLQEAIGYGVDMTGTIADMLDDADGEDLSWRTALLARAADYGAALAPNSAYRGNLVIAVGNVLNTVRGEDADVKELRRLAFRALGLWGSWPDDAAEEVFMQLEDEPTDENLLSYYRAYLAMAKVSDALADAAIQAVRAGSIAPTKERIVALIRG